MDLHIFMEWMVWLDDQEHGNSKNRGLVTRISVKGRMWVDLYPQKEGIFVSPPKVLIVEESLNKYLNKMT